MRESEDQHSMGGAHRKRGRGTPSKAQHGTWRGLLWTLVVAIDFCLMSNPLVFIVNMDRALTLAVLLTGLTLLLTFSRIRAPRIALPVLLFLAWLLASCLWSIQPSFTAAAWAQTLGVTAVAAAIYANVSARVLATGFTLGGVVVVVASIYAFHEKLPGAGAAPLDTWVMAGIGTNRNILAYTLALSLCGALAFVPSSAWARALWLGAVAVIGYGLVDVDSSTGDLTVVALVTATVLMASSVVVTKRFLHTTRRRGMAVIVMAAAAILACLVVTQLLGQDLLTFSDRTPLWSAAISVAQERPIQGFGYGAVWQHPWKTPLLNIVIGDIWDRAGYPLSHGHNSAVDLVVEVGLVGVLLWAVVMVAAGRRAMSVMRLVGPDREDDLIRVRFAVLCLVDLVVFGITEPMATIPLGWWALVLLTEPLSGTRRSGWRTEALKRP